MGKICIFLWHVTHTHNITVIHQHYSYTEQTLNRRVVRGTTPLSVKKITPCDIILYSFSHCQQIP